MVQAHLGVCQTPQSTVIADNSLKTSALHSVMSELTRYQLISFRSTGISPQARYQLHLIILRPRTELLPPVSACHNLPERECSGWELIWANAFLTRTRPLYARAPDSWRTADIILPVYMLYRRYGTHSLPGWIAKLTLGTAA